MGCRYCGGEISPEDPLYLKIHYRCANKVYKDLERLKIMRVMKKQGMLIQGEIRNSFLRLLNEEMKMTQSHIVTDDSVDEDILEMWAVIKAVMKRIPKLTPQDKLGVYCETVFNALMIVKYGSPLPENKKFHSRAKEFAEEIHTIEVGGEQFNFLKQIGRYAA